MRIIGAIALCLVLNVTSARLAAADDQSKSNSAAITKGSAGSGDELHFVDVLTLHGKVIALEPANRRVTLKGPNGEAETLEVRKEKDLDAIKVGDRVVVRYFEGVQIHKKRPGEIIPLPSLKDGIVDAEAGGKAKNKHAVVASVEAVDAGDQEVTLKAPDGSLETIMVANPEYLGRLKRGDQVVITRAQALALSVQKEDQP